jgi:cyclase
MDADGTLNGYDNELLAAVTSTVNIPVIASGGAGKLEHLYDAFTKGQAHAVLAASILHFGTFSIADIKQYLSSKGLPVRPVDGIKDYDLREEF